MYKMIPEERKTVYGKLNDLDDDIKRILQYLENDNKTNSKGLIEEVKDLREDVNNLIVYKKVQAGKMLVYIGIGTAVLYVAIYFAKLFITKSID